MYAWITTRPGGSSPRSSRCTCSSRIRASSSGRRYPASVARPSGGKSEYLIVRKNGLVASVSAGRIIVTRMPPTLGRGCGEGVSVRCSPVSGTEVRGVQGRLQRLAVPVAGDGRAADRVDVRALCGEDLAAQPRYRRGIDLLVAAAAVWHLWCAHAHRPPR